MREQSLKIIIYNHLKKTLSEKGKRKLANLTHKHPGLPNLIRRLENERKVRKDIKLWRSIGAKKDPEYAWAKIQKAAIVKGQRQSSVKWMLSGIAALLIIFFGIYLLSKQLSPKQKKAVIAITSTDWAPGRDQAILTLSNGQKINLDTVQNGYIFKGRGASIMKTNSGELTYDSLTDFQPLNTGKAGSIEYNTLEVPRMGQFSLKLLDGSKIFLNNASTLHYPVSFSGESREVELNGEGYFEVARNVQKRFHVHVIRNGENMTIDVLGTRFNVSAYSDDEKIQTSLLAGSVRINSGERTELMKPGEQLTTGGTASWQRQSMEDPDAVIAWTKGQFHFIGNSLPDVLRQLERWYDVKADLRIHGSLSQYSFYSVIDRTKNLSSILETLSYGKDIKFLLERKKLIVTR